MDKVITFDENCKLWILAIFHCEVNEDRIVIDSDTKIPVRNNLGEVVYLDNFAGIYKKSNDIGFITCDLMSLITALDDGVLGDRYEDDELRDEDFDYMEDEEESEEDNI